MILCIHSSLSHSLTGRLLRALGAAIALAASVPLAVSQSFESQGTGSAKAANGEYGPSTIRLGEQGPDAPASRRSPAASTGSEPPSVHPTPYVPGEFELFVNRLAKMGNSGQKSPEGQASETAEPPAIRRFGSDLVTGARGAEQDYAPQVPADYLISPGDELVVAIWGAVDANLRLVVDRAGRITIPRVGTVMVAGVRHADLPAVIRQQVAQVFKNFQLSVSLGQLRSIRVYVTGFTRRPGSYTVSSLASIVNALMRTGGPSAAGSFRNIELYRAGKLLTSFDLYDLLLRGDKSADRSLQAEDVIHVGPVGPQIALIGSVNRPAIFELKNGETIEDVLHMAAGFSAVADRTRLAVERLVDRNDVRVTQLALPADARIQPSHGDVLRAFSLVQAALPVQRQNKRVRVEGEVAYPGEFILPASSTVNDALRAAGGLTPLAYLFGTEFNRESVRIRQQEHYERALQDLETEFTRSTSTRRVSTADEATVLNSRTQATSRLIERLRNIKPTGRIVLRLAPDQQTLPDLALEDGDRLYVPPRPTTVGVFGSVVNGGSYLFSKGRAAGEYLRMAGGATRGADMSSAFLLRADGTAVSNRQSRGWFGLGSGLDEMQMEPGDTIFIPEEIDKSTFLQTTKDWTQILYQFGLGVAGIASAVK